MAAHRDAKDLLEIGAYVPGTNPLVDRAVALDARSPLPAAGPGRPRGIDESWSRLLDLVAS
jgi:flagellum-specific ATP synthase